MQLPRFPYTAMWSDGRDDEAPIKPPEEVMVIGISTTFNSIGMPKPCLVAIRKNGDHIFDDVGAFEYVLVDPLPSRK